MTVTDDPFNAATLVPEYTHADRQSKYWNSGKGKLTRGSRVAQENPFVGVDGEGGNDPNGVHRYYLLRVGTACLYRDGTALTTYQCLDFLTTCRAEIPGIFVAFFFDYDVTMICADLPLEIKRELTDRDSRAYKDVKGRTKYRMVQWEDFALDYIPHKSFTVRRLGMFGEYAKAVTISDTSGFFQTSFLNTMEAWKIKPELFDEIKAGKIGRSDFTGTYSLDEIRYNALECEILAELMTKVREACNSINVRPTRWEGAGCLAQAALASHNAPKNIIIPAAIADIAQYAYIGGHFEVYGNGHIRKPVHEYDLASAYPWALTKLPCLGVNSGDGFSPHGYWKQRKSLPNNGNYYIADVSWNTTANGNPTVYGPLPIRSGDGRIRYPSNGRGWYWSPEVNQVTAWTDYRITLHDVWEYIPTCSCKPYDWIVSKFEERKALGKSDRGKIVKLLLNSLYGKTAQSIGTAVYANAVLAGLITSLTRAKMMQVINTGIEVVMVATDGIYTTEPIDKTIIANVREPGEDISLGDWEHAIFEDLFIIQAGLYFTTSGKKLRTRGVTPRVIESNIPQFIETWERDGFNGEVTVKIPKMFIGMRMALHLGKPELAGQWLTDVPRIISFRANEHKRELGYAKDMGGWKLTHTLSWDGPASSKYKKIIGGDNPFTINDMLEYPDYVSNELDIEGIL